MRALAADEPGLLVHADATQLARAPKGAAVVLVPDAAQAGWLNVERPILAERALRVILFSDAVTSAALARKAPDFFHWISHRLECPPGPWPPAIWGIRAAAKSHAGILWNEGDLDAAFAVALPGITRVRVPTTQYGALVRAIRAAGDMWVEVDEIDDVFELRRLRWALTEAGRKPRAISRVVARGHSPLGGTSLWRIEGRWLPLSKAIEALERAGIDNAGRVAALLELEPDAIATAAELIEAGLSRAELEDVARAAGDPAERLAQLRVARGLSTTSVNGAFLLRGNLALLDAPFPGEAQVSEHRWFAAAHVAVAAGDPEVAVHWARRGLSEGDAGANAAPALGVMKAALPTDLAGVLHSLGNVVAARDLIEEAQQIVSDPYQTDDPAEQSLSPTALLKSLAPYALAPDDVIRADRLARYRSLLEAELSFHLRAGAEDHPSVFGVLRELARVLAAQSNLVEARALLERALRIGTKLYVEDHPELTDSVYELARICLSQGDFSTARVLLERALHLLAKVEEADGSRARSAEKAVADAPRLMRALGMLAMARLAQGDLAGAREPLERAQGMVERMHGTFEHVEVATLDVNLGSVLLALGERQSGLALLRRGHETLHAQLGPEHPMVRDATVRLARAGGHTGVGERSTADAEPNATAIARR